MPANARRDRMKLTQSQLQTEDQPSVYTAPQTIQSAEAPTIKEIELPIAPDASALATDLTETKPASRFRNLLRTRKQREKQGNAENKASAVDASGRLIHGLTNEQRRRMRNDSRLIFGPSTMKALAYTLIVSIILRRWLISYDQPNYMLKTLLWLCSVLGLLGLWMIFGVLFARRRLSALKETNTIDVNVLLYGVGRYVNVINKRLNQSMGNWHQDRYAVLQLLPSLESADADLVSARSHRILNRCLQSSDPELALSVLEVLPRIGTQSALPHVEALTNGKGKLGGDILVREAATSCLILLNERLANLDTKTLLRASQPEQSETELLRAADTETVTAPEQLLRASKNNDS